MAASELGVCPPQLSIRRVGAPEEGKHADFPRADARLTLVDADAPRNAFQAGDLTPTDARRPGKGLADANRPLDADSHLDQDVAGRHGRERSVGQTVDAVSPANRRGGARHRRTARRRDAGQATILPRKRCQPRAGAKCAASRGGAPADTIASVMSSPRLMTSGTSGWAREVPNQANRGGIGRLVGRVSRLEARGARPDQGGDEPEVAPVQRVHERAVQEDPEPGS
jgi:hypothetical protein